MIRGTARFDGLVVGEVTANFMGGTTLSGKAAFVSSSNGQTHGWTTGTGGWSKATLAKLQELRELMEVDLAALHFSDAESAGGQTAGVSSGLVGGLGEHLASGEPPQI